MSVSKGGEKCGGPPSFISLLSLVKNAAYGVSRRSVDERFYKVAN